MSYCVDRGTGKLVGDEFCQHIGFPFYAWKADLGGAILGSLLLAFLAGIAVICFLEWLKKRGESE